MVELKMLAKMLMLLGGVLVATGVVVYVLTLLPGAGKLPGDIHIKGKQMTVYFPIVTCLVASIVITVILNIFSKGR